MSKLFWKYLLVFWLAVCAVIVAVDGISSLLRWIDQVPTLDSETSALRARVATLATLARTADEDAMRAQLRAWRQDGAESAIRVIDERGHELLDRPLSADDLRFARQPDRNDAPYSQWVGAPGGPRYAVFIPEHVAGRLMYRTRIQIAWKHQLFAALLVGTGFSAFLAWYWAAPLRSLQWALHNVAQGHLDTRVAPRLGGRRDEISRLGAEFDSMAQRIELLVNAQQRLLHDVSHELRSPLARLEATIEVMLLRHGDLLQHDTQRVTHEIRRLNGLVDELLLLARLENGIGALRLGAVDVMELVVAIADDAQFEARAKGRDLHLDFQGSFVAEVDAELLYRAFENVIRNGVKYTAHGTALDVRAAASDDALCIVVADRGPGLSDDELASIFEPFRRFETNPGIGGFGLGLAIAKHAMEAHRGSIAVARNRDAGLTFTLTLRRDLLASLAAPRE
ncbi:putative two-component sensor histidine kinase [Janthinobacterium sp. HH01]|uniref:HAMP domain-containing sensor histidine kinase n=1 Tax=Janthinobacterium sp. HH01 TaxID=1198452 RepID=UPI0002AEB0F5|nr:HAMP domain-containing sensor histidine kinase [Janthinobacterium sp. HH01]ELX13512.1 putative two-component sensor histidine kinase [Janthinobacterium sp. HH01]